MKRKNKTLLTFMLAGALCAATIGGTLSLDSVTTYAAEEGTYALSDVFAKDKATFDSDESEFALFNISDGGTVNYKRNLALKWYDNGEAKYFTLKFAFQSLDFEQVDLTFESASAWATEEDKATNKVSFIKEASKIYVQVNDGNKVVANFAENSELTLSLAESTADGEFTVKLDGAGVSNSTIGVFENIGANYAEYDSGTMIPLQVKAALPEAEKPEEGEEAKDAYLGFILKEINGQDFKIVEEAEDNVYVKDNAAPVLVVNEKLGGFLLGTNFSIDYEKIDVLQSSSLSSKIEYEQWSPNGNVTGSPTASDLYFFETPYETEDGKTTTVYLNEGKEYVSIKVTLGDKVFKNDDGEENVKKVYDLTWYASEDSVATKGEQKYIVIDRNEEGATYTHLEAKAGKNEVIAEKKDAYEASKKAFQTALDKQAKEVYAGSNAKITIPSVKWLIDDNNGFRNLDFIISYKTPSSASASATGNLAYNALKFAVESQGQYEFKVFAKDKAGNAMQYYLDGELVDVTSSNVWDIEEIPSFSFEIENKGLIADKSTTSSTSQRKASKDVGDKYTLSDIKIVGATNLKENYALYRIDTDKAEDIGLDTTALTKVTFVEIASALATKITTLEDSYFELYLDTYAELLAKNLGSDKETVKACFVKIEEFDDRIDEELHADEWNKNNKYNWSVSSQSFTVAEEGNYVILADYWESELPLQRVAAYKVIVAETEVDILESGNSWLDWVKTNVVSVILFAIAGVMLILIIILLFIKPSDETLEDVDKKAAGKKENDKKED